MAQKHFIFGLILALLFMSGAVLGINATSIFHHKTSTPWGFNMDGRDTHIRPGDDFFHYANGQYLKNLKIPSDMSSYGPFDMLAERSRQRVRDILEELAKQKKEIPVTEDEKLGTFYSSFMNEKLIEKRDIEPLHKDLQDIRSIQNLRDLARLTGTSVSSYQFAPFAFGITPDPGNPKQYVFILEQAGLGLPDRDYYIKAPFAPLRKAYHEYIERTLGLIGADDAQKSADDILTFETQLAQAHWQRDLLRDPKKTYNPYQFADLQKKFPGFNWQEWFSAANVPQKHLDKKIIIGEPSAVAGELKVLEKADLPTIKIWLTFHLVDNASPYLSKRFVQSHFAFMQQLTGQKQLPERWKRGVQATSFAMGMALGKNYIQHYFPQSNKEAMQTLTSNLKEAFAHRLEQNHWMSQKTRQAALRKLNTFDILVGYPKNWRSYDNLHLEENKVYENLQAAIATEWHYWLSHLGHKVDRTEWDMTPQTVNAYNNPLFNQIVFPAAILQPPFYDPKADMAVNYGGIGGVIGHEMTHGFDDEGRHYDENGQLKNWWTREDAERFQKLADKLGQQYAAFSPIKGLYLNPKLTMGENIADLGGLTLALDAYHLSLNGKEAPVIDGLTGDQRVFLGWAQVWRQKLRPESIKRRVVIDPHSPPQARVNLPMHNIDLWYKAWNVTPDEKLYLAPDKRVKIW